MSINTEQPTMVFEQVDTLLLCCHGKKNPSDAEWQSFLTHLKGVRDTFDSMRTLIWTLGGGPTVAQRKQLNEVMAGKSTRGAVVSAHPGIRFVVSALTLMNRDLKTFSPDEIPDALLYLGLSGDTRRIGLHALERLRGRISGGA